MHVLLYFGQIKRTNNHLVHTVHLRPLNADAVNNVMNMLEIIWNTVWFWISLVSVLFFWIKLLIFINNIN